MHKVVAILIYQFLMYRCLNKVTIIDNAYFEGYLTTINVSAILPLS